MAREGKQPVYCNLGTRSRGRDRHQWEERRARAAEFGETGRTRISGPDVNAWKWRMEGRSLEA